jgi:hypothetical protein
MLDYLTLTPLDWDKLTMWRERVEAGESIQSVLITAVAEAKPVTIPGESELLASYEQDKLPLALRVYRGLRVHPKKYLGEAIKFFEGQDIQRFDNALIALAQAGNEMNMMMNPDVFLGYVSERYRILISGEGGPVAQVSPNYEADPVFVKALAWRTDFEPLEGSVYSNDEVRSISAALDAVNADDYPRGNLSPVFDYIEYQLDPDFRSRGFTLNEQFLDNLSELQAHYRDAAGKGYGMGVRPPADR